MDLTRTKKKALWAVQTQTNLVEKWNSLEKGIFPGKEAQFVEYLRNHIEEDMKEGMLLPMRRRAGLKDVFFYNNAQECSNFKFKSKIKEANMLI